MGEHRLADPDGILIDVMADSAASVRPPLRSQGATRHA